MKLTNQTKTALTAISFLLVCSGNIIAGTIGIGFSGGGEFPISHSDQTKGQKLDLRILFKPIPGFGIEPTISYSILGHGQHMVFWDSRGGKHKGGRISAYGVDLTVGGSMRAHRIRPYFLIGGAYYNFDLSASDDYTNRELNKIGWSIGIGLNIGISPKMEIAGRAKLTTIPKDYDYGKNRSFASLTAGLNYYFGI